MGCHHLYVLSKNKFAVKSSKIKTTYYFDTMEDAAVALLALGAKNDDIDKAVMHMYAHEHNHAEFGIEEGKFTNSYYVENLVEGML